MEAMKLLGKIILWGITFSGVVALAYYMWKDKDLDM